MTKLAHFHQMGIGGGFGFYITADEKNSKYNAAYISQGGLGLPERSYYLEKSERFEKIRTAYATHITNMLVLGGTDAKQAAKDAQNIITLETALATAARTPVENRDPQKTYNKKSTAELQILSPNINWKGYWATHGINNELKEIIVGQPEFFKALSNEIKNTNIKTWQAYLRWNLLRSTSAYLSTNFTNETFDFYSKTLRGTKVQRPRWKRIQDMTNAQVGEALGKLYVARSFTPEAKQRMELMIQDIRAAFAERIKNLDWMGAETKEKALIKLNAIIYKIGYPSKWRDYSKLDIRPDDYIGNNLRTNVFDYQEMLSKLTKPVDKEEWGMTPPTVNAYYNPTINEIVFPAGILQPPFFDVNADDAVNYGGIGAVIAHELTHGFDDQGSQYDAEGNLKNWWTDEDLQRFKIKTDRIIAQFDEYTVLDTVHVNGALTVGENIADLGGVTIAYEALQRRWAKNGKPEATDGLTPEQRFCISFAQIWRGKYRDQALLERIKTDPHSPGEYRANGTLSNFPEFYKAFDVKPGDPMRLPEAKQTTIW
jgi:putative endopeptidase